MIDRFRDLRAFLIVAEELHFGRAAIRLGMAQPNLSAIINRLEARIGTPLLRRRPSVALTAAGEIVVQGARKTMEQLETIAERAALAGAGEIGLVRIGFASTAMLGALPDSFRAFRAEHPEIELRLREMTSTDQWEALRLGDLDLAITRDTGQDEAVRKALVNRESLCVAIGAGHALAAGPEPIPLHALADEDFVLFRRSLGAPLYDMIIGLCAVERFAPRIVQEVDELHSVLGFVRAGFGIALVPEGLSRVVWPGVAFRTLATASLVKAELFCCWCPGTAPAAALRFVESLVRTAALENEAASSPLPVGSDLEPAQ
jgi:DNA-binding transcriptional LysR family regulator